MHVFYKSLLLLTLVMAAPAMAPINKPDKADSCFRLRSSVGCNYCCFFLFNFFSEICWERPWWPIQCLDKGRKKKVRGEEEREIRSSLLILDLKDGKS